MANLLLKAIFLNRMTFTPFDPFLMHYCPPSRRTATGGGGKTGLETSSRAVCAVQDLRLAKKFKGGQQGKGRSGQFLADPTKTLNFPVVKCECDLGQVKYFLFIKGAADS